MRSHSLSIGSERGAILIHVALSLLAFTAFSAIVVDYGVFWVSRSQAQNAADAAAHAGAISMSCSDGDRSDGGVIKQTAIAFAEQNPVWFEPPSVLPADITFPACPNGAADSCVRADVFRSAARANPLPTYFAGLIGIASQDVRATATAQILPVSTVECLRPWAVPDKWIENYPTPSPWTTSATFDKYYESGPNKGEPLPNPDVYVPPSLSGTGTGFRTEADCGIQTVLKQGDAEGTVRPGFFYAVEVPREDGATGGNGYRDNITSCNKVPISIGDLLDIKSGNVVGPTRQGVSELIAQDPTAYWDPATRGIRGGCMEARTCAKSPRLVAIPVFDIDRYQSQPNGGGKRVLIRNIMGFFVDRLEEDDVVGYLTLYPGIATWTPALTADSAFLKMVALVR